MVKVPTEADYKFANEIIDMLIENGYSKDLSHMKIIRLLDSNNITYYTGCTKVCIVPKDFDWVIKFSTDIDTDFCVKEYENFNCAMDCDLEEYFAATYRLRDNFYIQEKAYIDEDKNADILFDYEKEYIDRDEYDSEDKFRSCLSDAVCDMEDSERIYAMLGSSDQIRKLIDFCERFEINDLHPGNWGKTERGNVMVDFSGF